MLLCALVFTGLAAPAVSLTLAWAPNAETNIFAYRLYYGPTSRSYSASIHVSAETASATVSNLVDGRRYYFAVSAVNATGLESAKSAEVSYIASEPEIVSVMAASDAGEPKKLGQFVLSRAGNAQRPLTVHFSLEGTAVAGVDYRHPGNRIAFRAGQTNVTLFIRPIADRQFEGAKTLVLSLIETNNVEPGDADSAAILVGDDDRPRLDIASIVNGARLQTLITAAAHTNLSVILQRSTDLINWTVVAAPQIPQPLAYTDVTPTAEPTRFYRVIYVNGEITEASIAEALSYQRFSANIVGTVNVSMQPGWNLAANPLNGLKTDGPLGELPSGTLFVPFKSRKVNTYQDAKWNRGVPLTRATQGGWLYNPTDAPVNVTYAGEIPSTAGKPTIPAGWSVRSAPISGLASNDELLGYPLNPGDGLYEFNSAGVGADMWINHLFGANGWGVMPNLTAGQGVLIYKTKPTRPNITPAPVIPNLVQFVTVTN